MDVLFQHHYDIASAISSLVPSGGPVLCRDEMEEWSASEANLFEEALEKYGKDFTDIRQDFVSWPSVLIVISLLPLFFFYALTCLILLYSIDQIKNQIFFFIRIAIVCLYG